MRTSFVPAPRYGTDPKRYADDLSLYLENFRQDVIEDIKLTTGVWDDLRFPVSAVKVNKDKPPEVVSYKGSEVYGFRDQLVANEESISFTAQIPHAWKESSQIELHLHWVPQDNTAGNVYWTLTYSWANISGTFPTQTTVNIEAACPEVTDYHKMSSFGYLVGEDSGGGVWINSPDKTTPKGMSSMLLCTIKRSSSNILDTYNGKSAYFLEADFHYERDTCGSRGITDK